jgi:hypothetical protein
MTRVPTTATLVLVLGTLGAVTAADDGARALVQRVADAAPPVRFVATLGITTTGGLERRFTMSGRPLEDGGEVRYIEVFAPFNLANTRYLLFARPHGRDEQFLYVPTMQRVMRLSESTRREPFLGSTFYILDLIRPEIDDFTYAFDGDATVAGHPCRLVIARPKRPDEEFYGRSRFAVDPTDLVVRRAELFDSEGTPLKVLHVDRLERIEGRWTATSQRMENVRDGGTSTLTVTEVDYDAEVPDETFTVGHLGR